MYNTLTVTNYDIPRSSTQEDVGDRHSSRPGTSEDNLEPIQLLLGEPQRIEQRRQHHDRRAVLVVVKDRDVKLLLQLALDLETPRSGDVFQVDSAKADGQVPYCRHNF